MNYPECRYPFAAIVWSLSMTNIFQVRSRTVLWLACTVFAAVWIWVAATAGAELPGQFDASGTVTRWDSTWSFLGPIGGIAVALAVTVAGVRPLIRRVPAHAINLPSRTAHRYWIDPVNRGEFDRRIAEDVEWIGAATMALLAWITAVSGLTTADSVSVWVLAVPTVLYLAGALGYCVFMIRGPRYRVPR